MNRQNKYKQQACTASDMHRSVIKQERATHLSISVTQLDFTPQKAREHTISVAPLIEVTVGKLASQVEHSPALHCIRPINLSLKVMYFTVSQRCVYPSNMQQASSELVIHTILLKLYHYFECESDLYMQADFRGMVERGMVEPVSTTQEYLTIFECGEGVSLCAI